VQTYRKILIKVGQLSLRGELFDTPSGRAVAEILPIKARINLWGDEFYFEVPLDIPPDETSTADVQVGDIGYWPPGRALALFFGPTPMSIDEKPVPASEVNRAGRIIDDPRELIEVKSEEWIEIEAL